MSNRLTQHEIRKIAVQVLYSLALRPEQKLTDLEDYILDGRELSAENREFLDSLLTGVQDNRDELDAKIAKFLLKSWSINRLTLIDRTILRIGAFEILDSEVADKIAIDEAINLAKDFSDPAAVKLINGILTNLIEK